MVLCELKRWLSSDFVLKRLECLAGDRLCETDRVGFEAIAQLHSQIDDDHDGTLDRTESAEVLILSWLLVSLSVTTESSTNMYA